MTYLPLNRSAIHRLIEGYRDGLIDKRARCSIAGITELTVRRGSIVKVTALVVMPEAFALMLTAPSAAFAAMAIVAAIWVLLVTGDGDQRPAHIDRGSRCETLALSFLGDVSIPLTASYVPHKHLRLWYVTI
jgi:hypothetical protein